MSTIAAGFTRYTVRRVHRVEDARLLQGRGTYVDDIERPGMLHACFVRSPLARGRIVSVDVDRGTGAPRRPRRVPRRGPQPGCARAVALAARSRSHRRRRDRRSPTVRCASSATRSRSWSPTIATSPRTRASSSIVDYEPLPPIVDYVAAVDADVLVHEDHGTQRRPRRRRAGIGAGAGVRGRRARRRGAVSTSRRTPPCRLETRGHGRRARPERRRDHDVGRDAGAARAPRVLRAPARHPRAPRPRHRPRHRRRLRAEDPRAARGDVPHARRPEAAGRGEVDRGPAGEPDGRGLVPPRARRRPDGLRRRRRDPGASTSTSCPTPARTPRRGPRCPRPWSAPSSPGRTAYPQPASGCGRSTPTPPGVPAIGDRGSTSRSPARSCSRSRRDGWASTPSSCGAATSCALDDMPYTNANGMTYDCVSPLETFEHGGGDARLRRLPRRSRRAPARPAGTWASASPTTSSRPRRRSASSGPRARRSASSPPARSTCTSPADRRATAWRRRSCNSPPTRSASTSRTCDTIQGDTALSRLRRRHRRQPQRGDARRRHR